MRWPGIEPGSTAWEAAMLTTIPPTPTATLKFFDFDFDRLHLLSPE